MSSVPDEDQTRLAADAEAYEATSARESATDHEFETQHPGLAKTLRLLQAVFHEPWEASCESAPPQPSSLTQIGRFQIIRGLGSGNFGSVWLAHDPVLKRDVAIKVAHVGVHARADLQERFEREAHLAARLHHPNIVPVLEAGVDDGRLFIVSEYSEGPTLDEWLDQQARPIEPLAAADLLRQLADAADHAHRQGLIHRDIKPANVLLSVPRDGSTVVPRLMDFGLARDLTSETSLTRHGMLVGTAAYMSPEQATGNVGAQGPASDIFSLGVTLYRLLTGTTPFTGQTEFEVIQKIITAEPVALQRSNPNVPLDLSSICLKCMEKEPSRRYASAAELHDELNRFIRGEATLARPISSVERIVRWSKREPTTATLVFVSFACLAVVIAGLGFYLRQASQHSHELASALQNARDEREIADVQRRVARETSYRSDMRLAFDLWNRGQIHPVREILERQGEDAGDTSDLRGPEWFVLNAEFRSRFRELGRHDEAVSECVLSRDESTVYSVGTDGFVRVWDVRSGRSIRSFQPPLGELHALALSPDESTLAVGGETWLLDRAEVHLLDARTGTAFQKLQSHETTIESIAYSPDGQWLAAGSRYQPVQLTRLEDGATFTLDSNRRNRCVSFSSDSKLVAVVAHDARVAIWQLDSDRPVVVNEISRRTTHAPYVARFAPGRPLLATIYASGPSNISLYDADRRVQCGLATSGLGHNDAAELTCAGFSPDARLLAAGDSAGAILLWELDAKRFKPAARFAPLLLTTPHVARVTSVVTTGRSALISSGEDGRIVMTSPFASGAVHLRWEGIRVNAAVLDGSELLLACHDGTVRRHSLDSLAGTTQCSLPAAPFDEGRDLPPEEMLVGASPTYSLAVSPHNELMATGTVYGGVNLYRRDTGEFIRSLVDEQPDTDDTIVRDLFFSSDGRLLAHTGEKGRVVVHATDTGEEMLSEYTGNGWTVRFTPGDRFVVWGGRSEQIRIFDLDSGKLSHSIAATNASALDISPDGRILASAHLNGTVQLHDLTKERESQVIRGHRGLGASVAFSSHGRVVSSLDKHGVLQFTDVETGVIFGRLKLPDALPALKTLTIHQRDDLLAVTVSNAEGAPISDLYLWRLK